MMCEPQVFGLWAGSSLAKMPSDGRAGGPRLGLNTSLLITREIIGGGSLDPTLDICSNFVYLAISQNVNLCLKCESIDQKSLLNSYISTVISKILPYLPSQSAKKGLD